MIVSSPVFILLATILNVKAYLPLPPYVQPCSVKDAVVLEQCARERSKDILPHLMYGDELYAVPQLDPLFIDRLEVDNSGGALGFKLIATDLEVYGLRNATVDNVTHSMFPQEETYFVTIPDVYINCTYNVTGRILLFPILGYGGAVIILKNVTAKYRFEWELRTLEDGEVYFLPVPGAYLNIETDSMHMYLDNLFNGDVTLATITLNFINLHWQDVFNAMRPSFTKTFSNMISGILDGIFRQVPYKYAFLDTGLE